MKMLKENDTRMTNSSLRWLNLKRIFDLLYEQKELTQAEIKEMTGLSGPTVTQSLFFFKDIGLFKEGEKQASSGGRKALPIAFDYQAYHAVGVEIRVHHVDVRILDLSGEVASSQVYRLDFAPDDSYWSKVNELVCQQIRDTKEVKNVLGIQIGFPGEVDLAGERVSRATVLGIKDLAISGIRKNFSYPVRVSYGADAAAFGAVWRSKKMQDAVYIIITYDGIAGSVIIDNKLYHGAGGRSGAFGHIVLEPKGKSCFCGGRGCWSAYCSLQNLYDDEKEDLKSFFDRVEAGDQKANDLLDVYLIHLAQGIANVRLSFDSDIIIGGKIVPYFSPYLDRLVRLVSAYPALRDDEIRIRPDLSSSSPIAEGAALQLIACFLDDELPGFTFKELSAETA